MNETRFPTRVFLLFATLSAADFVLTWHLLSRGGSFYEANPVAGWFLAKFGWAGLAAFKAATVLVVATLATIVGLNRPKAARNLLAFGCVAVGLVVGYSSVLTRLKPGAVDATSQREDARSRETAADLDSRLRFNAEYRNTLNLLGREFLERRITLADAVNQLAETDQARDANWNRGVAFYYPSLSMRGRLAVVIVQNMLRLPTMFPGAIRQVDRLKSELRDLCGVDVYLDYDASTSIAEADGASSKTNG